MFIEKSFRIVETFLTNKSSPILECQFRFLLNCLFMSLPQIHLEIIKILCFKRDTEQFVSEIKIGLHQFANNISTIPKLS